jgi:hypothetical protein
MICLEQAWRFGDAGERNGGDRGNKAEVVWQGNFLRLGPLDVLT